MGSDFPERNMWSSTCCTSLVSSGFQAQPDMDAESTPVIFPLAGAPDEGNTMASMVIKDMIANDHCFLKFFFISFVTPPGMWIFITVLPVRVPLLTAKIGTPDIAVTAMVRGRNSLSCYKIVVIILHNC